MEKLDPSTLVTCELCGKLTPPQSFDGEMCVECRDWEPKTSHTKTPWTVNADLISTPTGSVAHVFDPADADFIVRACNSHERLLEACKLGLSVAESWAHDQLDGTSGIKSALAELQPIRDAISEATSPNA